MNIHAAKKAAVASAFTLASLGLTACGASGSDDGVIRIAHNSNAAVLPARVAQEQGFFEDHGLKVKFTTVENISTLPPAAGKSFDIIQVPPTSLIAANSQGIDLDAIATATVDVKDNPTSSIITLKSSGISDLKDLEGKSVGALTESGTLHIATRFALDKAGVDPDSLKMVQMDLPVQGDQLAAGRVDAVESLEPFRGQLLAQDDAVDLGDPYLEMADELSAMMWGASGLWAKDHPKEIEGFRAALADAIEYIADNDDEARKVLAEYTGLPDDVVAKTPEPTYQADLRPDDLQIWLDAMTKVGGFKGDVKLADLVPSDD